MDKLTRTLLVPLFALCIGSLMMMPAPPARAQSVSLGADIMNRYVWRGDPLATTGVIQPSLSYSQSGFTIGAWGSYSLTDNNSAESAGARSGDEFDLYASYAFDLGNNGSFSVGVTDYYFPYGDPSNGVAGNDFFNYDEAEEGGRHTIEPNVSYTGPESLPISLYAAINAYGTSGEAVWLEASYPFSVESVDLSVALGTAVNDTDNFYVSGDNDAGITKLSLSASKSVEITDSFSLPLMASYYLNPFSEQGWLMFGLSL